MSYTYSVRNTEQHTNRRKTFSILIVDDDSMIANNLKTLLNFRGHNVTYVDDGAQCIAQCQENKYDIVFLDYHMEGLDGAQAAEIVKSEEKRTIVFAYTGDNSDKALTNFKSVGMDGVIVKPVDSQSIDMLMNKIENSVYLDKSTITTIARKSDRSILIFDEIKY